MPFTESPGTRIWYEVHGAPDHDPILLHEGMGAQLIGWRQGFIDLLVAQGLRVILMDARDVGMSEKLGGWRDVTARYALLDMADDVCRVLDTLGLKSAHIVGQSMGGVIAQTMAIHRAERVKSLCLIYTAPAFDEALIQPDFWQNLHKPLPKLPFRLPTWLMTKLVIADARRCFSEAYPADEAWLRELIRRSMQRGFRMDGLSRQRAAVMSGFDYRAQLSGITAPTTIIHGRADHAIKAEAAFELAEGIPDAGLHIYPGMGHAVAEPLWREFAAIIAGNARRATN